MRTGLWVIMKPSCSVDSLGTYVGIVRLSGLFFP
jgi:hypothetical protein